ncbi:MAG: helix-turn-helix transcriptional regulator [Actinomycetota bacterium]
MRASRLVSLLLLLQHRGRMTAEELAEELEVSIRTIYRDLEALSMAGVPVYTEPGRNGGCSLIDGYRTRLTGLTTKEAEALFAAGVPGPVGELGLGTVLGAANLKLLAALPPDLAERAAGARQRFHLDVPTWFRVGRNEPLLADLATAVWEDRQVKIRYKHPGGSDAATRHLDPFGLVCKAGTWYLVARRDNEMRTYRVSRVQDVTVLDATFTRPSDFDLPTFWQNAVSEFESQLAPVDVVVRATETGHRELLWMTRYAGRSFREQEPLDDGTLRCALSFESLDDAFIELMRLGAEVEVLEPVELRTRVAETVTAMVARYEG